MTHRLGCSAATGLLIAALCSETPAQAVNAATTCVLPVRAWMIAANRTFGARRLPVARRTTQGSDTVRLDHETALVPPGESLSLDVSVGFNEVDPTSIEVRSGCLSYDFALYPDGQGTTGEELLLYRGQSLNLADPTLPRLRDDDLTGKIHARFWNRGSMGCTFRLVVTGGGR